MVSVSDLDFPKRDFWISHFLARQRDCSKKVWDLGFTFAVCVRCGKISVWASLGCFIGIIASDEIASEVKNCDMCRDCANRDNLDYRGRDFNRDISTGTFMFLFRFAIQNWVGHADFLCCRNAIFFPVLTTPKQISTNWKSVSIIVKPNFYGKFTLTQ